MAVKSAVVIGMAELEVLKGDGVFSCIGLGSCIGLFMLDPVSNVAGMVHVMLPEAFADKPVDRPGKFANTGVPELLSQMEKAGASKNRIIAAMAGGACVFKFATDDTRSRFDIGARNTVAVTAALKKLGIPLKAQDTGGNLGRSVTAVLESGHVRVRTITESERLLINLRG